MPLEVAEFYAADLSPQQSGVRERLRMYIWFNGTRLPCETKELAKIAGVTVRTFMKMAPVIAPHFDIDEDGRWRHYDYEEQREAALAKHAARSSAGVKGANIKWNKSDETGAEGQPVVAPKAMANGMATAMANGTANEGLASIVDHGLPLASGLAQASCAPGSIDRSSLKDEDSIDRSNARGAGDDGSGMANAMANGAVVDVLDRPAQAAPAIPIVKPETDSVDAIAGAMRAIPGGKIPAVLLNRSDLAPILALIEQGCDLARDIVPAVTNFCANSRDPLRTFGNKHIREKACASRDRVRARPAGTPGWQNPRPFFVVKDSPPWRAWLRARNVRSMPAYSSEGDRTKTGAHFESTWPPGWDAVRLAAEEGRR